MRLILSRKGFDSENGGCPSPIFPDGSMISLPIPDRKSGISYGELNWRGRNLGELIEELTRGKHGRDDRAHLDPDLRTSALTRPTGWKPLFGQVGTAQGHLAKQGVGEGDLLLFFGLFRRIDQNFRWIGRPMHVVWGWMEVATVVPADLAPRQSGAEWLLGSRHPHVGREPDPSNTLYIATDKLRLGATELSGAGAFGTFSERLRLTAQDANGPATWLLPGCFEPRGRPPLTYHGNPTRWLPCPEGVRLQSVSKGQEFVLDMDWYPEAEKWVIELLRSA